MDADDEIELELIPFIRVYKSGRFERLSGTEVVPASTDPTTGVTSKDVVIDTGVSARLYLPNLIDSQPTKLPILIYYHGGGFITESAASPTYHSYVQHLAGKARFLVVSVDYRRAPEHPVPAAHEDSWVALKWVASHAVGGGPEAWLAEHGEFGRVFLAGDSSGANILHNMALRAGAEGLASGVSIERLALIHPYFLGKEPVGAEPTDWEWRERGETFWRFVCPSTTGLDDPLLNPLAGGAPSLAGLGCRRVVVCVAELVETLGEGHVFHLSNPSSENAIALMERLVAFLNRQ